MKLVGKDRHQVIGMIKFYERLLDKGKLLVGSAGHKRLIELKEQDAKYKRMKYGTAERHNAGTTK